MRYDDTINFNSGCEAFLELIDTAIEVRKKQIERLELLRHGVSQMAAVNGTPHHSDGAPARIQQIAERLRQDLDGQSTIPAFLSEKRAAQAEGNVTTVVPGGYQELGT